jgi:glycine/betaine/sarcosine/D-proline reductase family selenoprotein B
MRDDRALGLSRLCIPWTPFRGRLEEAVVCLVSTAGVRLASQPAFDTAHELGHRVIPGTATSADLAVDDTHYDHACVDLDRNCVFPVDRLRELVAAGRVGGLTERHFSTGYTAQLRDFAALTAVRLAQEVAAERPQAVVLTGGCRVCHRTAAALQRAIECQGISTVAITAEPEETAEARVPRALCPRGFVPGHALGPASDPALQRQVLLDALGLLGGTIRPGEVAYRDYGVVATGGAAVPG